MIRGSILGKGNILISSLKSPNRFSHVHKFLFSG